MSSIQYRDMTEAERLDWAKAEHLARIADLSHGGVEALHTAQKNAESRRCEIGATKSQVAQMLSEAGRIRRREEARAAIAQAGGES